MGGSHPHTHETGHSHGDGHAHHGSHTHAHDHAHGHAPKDFGPAFLIGIVLNAGFVVVEAVFGWLSGSMALIADAGHNLSDVLALGLAWAASVAARRPPTRRYTYGLGSSTILAALANAGLLVVAIAAILFETLHRIAVPAEVQGGTMAVVAGVGIVINAGTAALFLRGQHDLNIRGAFLHMAADALVSLGVVIAGLAILWTGAVWIDPAVSLLVVVVIAWSTWGLLTDSLRLGLNAVPRGVDESAVRRDLLALPGVVAVHDLHIWPLSTTRTALTAHLVRPAGSDDAFLQEAAALLRTRHGIAHTTLQIEQAEGGACSGCQT